MTSPEDVLLRLSPKIKILPIIHGSGDFAHEVRREILTNEYDCIALPLPPSFQEQVEGAVHHLPFISAVIANEADDEDSYNFVPIDPCQGVIMGIRVAMEERISRAFIDLEVKNFQPHQAVFPDPYSLKKLSLEKFSAAVLPSIPSPEEGSQITDRIHWMAFQVHCLELEYENILFLCPITDWPWVRHSYLHRLPYPQEETFHQPLRTHGVSEDTLFFILGELPYVTYLYERSRRDLTPDENLSIDGVKELVIEARGHWAEENENYRHRATPQQLGLYLKYVRNLTLLERRLAPDLYTLALAAKQVIGDDFAITLMETAKSYPYQIEENPYAEMDMGIDRGRLPDGEIALMKNRLAGMYRTWRSLDLKSPPREDKRRLWKMMWDPYKQCSWPPEDNSIESFNLHVREQAKAILGSDLARSEKFTASVKDGIDIRETLRNWYTGDIYVKEIPPGRGSLEVVVFLFHTPADPEEYRWKSTWYAEHNQESTLCFYATDYSENIIGPGIAQSLYGGAFFLFPPRYIPDIWTDSRFDFAPTLEERLLAGALYHSQERHVALVSPKPPAISWRRMAKRFKKKLIHIPLKRFSAGTVERLRQFHVLNGREVRSYAAEFIRNM